MMLPAYLAIFLSGLLISTAVAFWFPEYSKYYIKDNRVVENLGAQMYLWSGIVALYAAYLMREKRYIPIFFAVISFVFCLDEISWGRDELKFEPYQVLGVKIDAVHDFVDVLSRAVTTYGQSPAFLVVTASLLALLVFVVVKWRPFFRDFLADGRVVFLSLVLAFFAFSAFSDLGIIDFAKETKIILSIFEEYFEFSAGLALLFISLGLARQARARREMVSEPINTP